MISQIITVIESTPALSYRTYTAAALLVPIVLFTYRLTLHPLAKFPGPKIAACSSFYYLYWIRKGWLPQHVDRLFEQYDTDVIRIAPGQLIFKTHQSFRDISTTKEAYRGAFSFKLVGFTSKNLSNVKDPKVHTRKRKVMMLGFSGPTLAKQEPELIVPIVDKLIAGLTEVSGETINLCNYLDCVTTDVIGKLSFDAELRMLDQVNDHPFLHVLPEALKMSVIAQCLPPFYRLINAVYAYGPKFLTPHSLRGVADFTALQMDQYNKREGDASEKSDIMSVIISGLQKSKDPELQMDDRELLGEATTLVAAGGDTASSALTVTMWHLMQHPEIQKEVAAQLRKTYASDDEITSKSITANVPMVDACINEATRVTPVTPSPLWRHTEKAMMVDGHIVPGNTDVGSARYTIWHDKDNFHKPFEFIPKRWVEDLGDHLDAFQPWGLGLRTCIGRQIAMVEMRLILAKLLWKFDWEAITRTYDNPEFAVLYRAPLIVRATTVKA